MLRQDLQQISRRRCTRLGETGPESSPLDFGLALVLNRWPNLPAAIRRADRALVESAGAGD
jgi:hypothetical protein